MQYKQGIKAVEWTYAVAKRRGAYGKEKRGAKRSGAACDWKRGRSGLPACVDGNRVCAGAERCDRAGEHSDCELVRQRAGCICREPDRGKGLFAAKASFYAGVYGRVSAGAAAWQSAVCERAAGWRALGCGACAGGIDAGVSAGQREAETRKAPPMKEILHPAEW